MSVVDSRNIGSAAGDDRCDVYKLSRLVLKSDLECSVAAACDQTCKPGSVRFPKGSLRCHLSSRFVAEPFKPPLQMIRRADVKTTCTNQRCIG